MVLVCAEMRWGTHCPSKPFLQAPHHGGTWPKEGEAPAHLAQGSLPCSMAGAHCESGESEVGGQGQQEDSHTDQLLQACMLHQEVCFSFCSSG